MGTKAAWDAAVQSRFGYVPIKKALIEFNAAVDQTIREIVDPPRFSDTSVPVSRQGWKPENWEKQDKAYRWDLVNAMTPPSR